MTPPAVLAGGCACGAVRYECTAEPFASFNCHCRDCQRETGSAYAAIIAVPSAAFAVTKGRPKLFGVAADSGATTHRAFCAECGSGLYGQPERAPHMITIRVGSLDDPGRFRPSSDIFASRAQPWDYMDPSLPKHPKLPD